MYREFQVSIYRSKRDIDVKKKKVENAFFVYWATSQVFLSIFYYDIYIIVYGSILSIKKCLMQTKSYIAIPLQRDYCKLTPHDCCLSLNNMNIMGTFHVNSNKM